MPDLDERNYEKDGIERQGQSENGHGEGSPGFVTLMELELEILEHLITALKTAPSRVDMQCKRRRVGC